MTAVHDVDAIPPLTRRQLALLRFSARDALAGPTSWRAHRIAVWEAFGVGVVRYRQLLHHAARHPDALAAEPTEVRRMRRLNDRRARRGDST